MNAVSMNIYLDIDGVLIHDGLMMMYMIRSEASLSGMAVLKN